MKTSEARTRRIRVEDHETTIGEFFEANDGLSPYERSHVLALKPGETVRLGGGAFAEFDVTRLSGWDEYGRVEA